MRLSVQRLASKRQPFHSINRHVSFGEHGELDPDLHLETLEFFPKWPWTGFHGPCIQLASIDFERSQELGVRSRKQAGGRKILTSVF
jgi:hypothetical protein